VGNGKGFQKTYNDKDWYIKAVFINLVTNSMDTLITENITELTILNSLDNFTPSVIFMYKDSEYHISKHIQNFGCVVRIND
jgi:hypothetical protein